MISDMSGSVWRKSVYAIDGAKANIAYESAAPDKSRMSLGNLGLLYEDECCRTS